MLFGPDYSDIAAICLRIALLILPALHTAMWGTRFLRDLPKLSHPK